MEKSNLHKHSIVPAIPPRGLSGDGAPTSVVAMTYGIEIVGDPFWFDTKVRIGSKC